MSTKPDVYRYRIRLHVGIATIFASIIFLLTTFIIWNNHREASAAALRTADQLFQETTTSIDERLNGMLGAIQATVDVASALPSLAKYPRDDGLASNSLEAMIRLLETRQYVYSVFVGYTNGAWIQVLASRGDAGISEAFQIPDSSELVVRTISEDRHGARRQYLSYLDQSRHVVDARTEPDPPYDPRVRTWYTSAIENEGTLFSEPFIFFRLQRPGITASRRLIDGGGVVAVAITLSNLSTFLAEMDVSPNARVFLFDSSEQILARSDTSTEISGSQSGQASELGQTDLPKVEEFGDTVLSKVVRDALAPSENTSKTRNFEINGQTYLARTEPIGSRLGLDQFVTVVAPLTDFTGHIQRMQQRNILAAVLALAVAMLLIIWVARRIAAKLSALASEADKVRAFDLADPVDVQSIFLEVHNLSKTFGAMKQAVGLFGRYVPRDLVRTIVQSEEPPGISGQTQEITVLFSDIAEYTRIAEEIPAEQLMQQTSEYFEALGTELSKHRGVVDKYIGDSIMALWNAPSRDENHVFHACMAALACRRAGHALEKNWSDRGAPVFRTRFGLHCGQAVVGNVGGADRINFTAVGRTINTASRLEALNKRYGTEILLSGDVAERVASQFLMRRIDQVTVMGASDVTLVFELIAAQNGNIDVPSDLVASSAQHQLCAHWDRAYDLFLARDWTGSLMALDGLMKHFPDDAPSRYLADRCREFIDTPPASDWDGITRLSHK